MRSRRASRSWPSWTSPRSACRRTAASSCASATTAPARRSTSASPCLPTLFGEKIVMRLLDKEKLMLDMTRLGFEPESLARLERQIAKPWGMCLVTGPTGSGKTNTLYSSISEAEHDGHQHHDRGRPGRVQPPGRQPGQRQGLDRPELRGRPALLPAPGSEHHPGRRNPRLRNRGNRRQGRAHRPPRAVDAAHQRRAEHDQPPDEHGHRAVPGGELGEPDLRAAPGPPPVQAVQGSAPAAAAGLHRRRHAGGGRRDGDRVPAGRLRQVQQHRLQGPRRSLRGHGDQRAAARDDPDRRVVDGSAPHGARGRDVHAARERPVQGPRRR